MSVQIEIKNCTKNYRDIRAVKDVSLLVYEGEFLAIIGPSGCGKSTLLRCISGLEKPDKGKISIDNKIVFDEIKKINFPTEKRGASLVFQNYALWPHYNVFNNVAYPLKIKKIDRQEIKENVEKFLSIVRIKDKIARYPHELSGGEQQRVALARALIMEPKVLLLDEPLSNLDAKLREQMQTELVQIKKELNLTIVHVTHDQSEAMELADRIIVMNKGVIEQIGTPKDIYNNPNSIFVASFIGKTNIIKKYDNDEKENSLYGKLCDSFKFKDVENSVLSVRPEDITLVTKPSLFKGEITRVIYRGNITRHIIKYDKTELISESRSEKKYSTGDSVYFKIKKALVLKK